jgi:hypothetical protein
VGFCPEWFCLSKGGTSGEAENGFNRLSGLKKRFPTTWPRVPDRDLDPMPDYENVLMD